MSLINFDVDMEIKKIEGQAATPATSATNCSESSKNSKNSSQSVCKIKQFFRNQIVSTPQGVGRIWEFYPESKRVGVTYDHWMDGKWPWFYDYSQIELVPNQVEQEKSILSIKESKRRFNKLLKPYNELESHFEHQPMDFHKYETEWRRLMDQLNQLRCKLDDDGYSFEGGYDV